MIAQKFEMSKEYSEQAVNDIINTFDVDDHTLIRRELVNFNYLGKDTAKGIYWLKNKILTQDKLEKIKNTINMIKKSNFY